MTMHIVVLYLHALDSGFIFIPHFLFLLFILLNDYGVNACYTYNILLVKIHIGSAVPSVS